MILTVFASNNIEAWSANALLGYGLSMGVVLALILSSQRWLLWYISGGIVYWLSVEGIYSLLLNLLTLSEWHSYVAAMGISWLPIFGWITYRVLRYDTVSPVAEQQRELESTYDSRYIEHTPVYDADFQPRFR
ncbi:hypothetical protein ES754_09365 [Psychrobacter frigidicola]|uniref:Uncharacterized protein n=2 Tax=Psychrobacter frigidicola TaxID=45611 RepID=A0A5C7A193_9GAMM|nr:AciT family ciprofloxacin tolerance protein [Psychrobacter frigidicola]TXD96612.1 hypothetical protein ES754_09365 [Psychrobacter frigidicola]